MEGNKVYSQPILQLLHNNKKVLFQVIENFPVPVEIFSADGTVVLINRACLELNNISNADLLIGKFNLLHDTVYNDQLGLRDLVQRAFRGETVNGPFYPPIQNLVDRGIIKEKPYESADMDCYFYPVFCGNTFSFVVCVNIVKKLYKGRPDVAKAKEYIDTHWKEEFDFNAIAKYVNMSVTQLYSLFHKHTGMTPGDFYRSCKVEHIKENLADKNLSVKEAFAACGVDSRGTYARIFKKIAGVTPGDYRTSLK